ncbi:hypothetical protein MHYP_G00061290 [Metynnis hypsauchen]
MKNHAAENLQKRREEERHPPFPGPDRPGPSTQRQKSLAEAFQSSSREYPASPREEKSPRPVFPNRRPTRLKLLARRQTPTLVQLQSTKIRSRRAVQPVADELPLWNTAYIADFMSLTIDMSCEWMDIEQLSVFVRFFDEKAF